MNTFKGGDIIALASLSGYKGTEKICVHLVHLFYGDGVGMGINKADHKFWGASKGSGR